MSPSSALSLTWWTPGIVEKTTSFVALSGFFFLFFAVDRGSWRYVSIPDLISIIKATFVAIVLYTVGAFLMTRGSNVPRSVPILTGLYMVAGLSAPRLAYRMLFEHNIPLADAGPAEAEAIRAVVRTDGCGRDLHPLDPPGRQSRDRGCRDRRRRTDPSAADRPGRQGGRQLRSISVTSSRSSSATASPSRKSSPPISGLRASSSAKSWSWRCGSASKASRLPSATDTAQIGSDGRIEPKPIDLGDLLGRPEVRADLERVASLVNDRVVLATGAGGSIGSELCRQIAMFGPRSLTITDSSEFHLYLLDTELRERYPELPHHRPHHGRARQQAGASACSRRSSRRSSSTPRR